MKRKGEERHTVEESRSNVQRAQKMSTMWRKQNCKKKRKNKLKQPEKEQ